MMRQGPNRRRLALSAGLLLVAAACTSGSGDTTVPATAPPTSSSTTTSSTTTTSTIPLIANGPALIFEGDRNETVEAFQFLLNCNDLGQLTIDGAFGPATLAAVQAAQTSLGREVTGAPDEETLALLSRSCSEDRRVSIDDEDEGEEVVVGNAADADPEIFFVRAEEDMRMSVVATSEAGEPIVNVRATDGTAVGVGGTSVWATDIIVTSDYVVEVSATVPTTFVATVALVELDPDDVDSADDGEMILDDLDTTISDVCLDTSGESSYVAETALGHLVVTAGTVGRYALDRGGVGAPIEFMFKDGSPGYYGFAMDAEMEVGDVIEGTAIVFLREAGGADDPIGLSFNFDRAVTPCDGAAGTSVVLAAGGLGIVDFGGEVDAVLATVRSALIGASPTVDGDWVVIDNLSNEFGICRQGTTEVRVIEIDNLTLYFTDAGTSFADEGTRHFAAYAAGPGVFPFKTSRGVGPGATVADVLAAHPDAVAAAGITGGVDVFISSPPGSDRWLRATAEGASSPSDTGAIITSVTGGRFCDL